MGIRKPNSKEFHLTRNLVARLAGMLAIMLCMAAQTFVMAQTPVGQIFGTVKDPNGLPVPGASVVVTDLATGKTFNVKSDEAGDYLVPELPPGRYSVAGSLTGFKQLVRTPVTLVAFQKARVDLPLEVGETIERVVVTAETAQVDTRSNTLGSLVDSRLLTEMPISDRNIINTLNYTPGVQHISPGNNVNRNQQRLNIDGNRSYSTNVQLDGASMYFAHRGQGIELPAPDAIEEVQVVTSGVSAQYGRGTAVFAAVTKSGGNQFHGTAWEFVRNDAFDARPFFTVTNPFLRAHDFGGTFSGPIFLPKPGEGGKGFYSGKNKLFFFFEYQGLLIHQASATSTPFTPTPAERNGDFSADAQKPIDPLTGKAFPNAFIDPKRFDPIAVKILNMVPSPNLPSGALSFSGPNPTTGNGVVAKIDYMATKNDQLSFRWFSDHRVSILPFPASPAQSIPGYAPAPNSQYPKTLSGSWVRTWSPKLVSTTRFSFTRWLYDEGTSVNTTLADLGATNFVDQYVVKRLPTITVNGRFSATSTTIDERAGTDYDLAHDWNWIRGSHEFTWGTLLERISYRKPNSSTSAGTFTFDGGITKNSLADFLLGTPTKFVQSSGSVASGHYYPLGFYGQDTWKVRPRLTLTLGLRWDVYTMWKEDAGQQVTFIPGVQSTTFPTAPKGMVFQSDPQFPYGTMWKNFGPRVGFAWDVFGDGRTSFRGGYGISYDPLVAEPVIHGAQPFSLSVTVNNPGPLSNPYKNVPNPFPYTPNPSSATFILPASLEGLRGPFRPMYNQNFSLTLERQLTKTWAITSSYVGNLSRHGYNGFEGNPAVYVAGATTKNTDARRIYSGCVTITGCSPIYSNMQSYSSNLNTSYNAWQTIITKRPSHGLSVQAHYTWSRAIDQCSTEVISSCPTQDPFNPAGSRGLGDFDRTHAAVITYIYELPKLQRLPRFLRQAIGGWQIASFHLFQSGNPFSVVTGSDASLTGVGLDRPNVVSDPFAAGVVAANPDPTCQKTISQGGRAADVTHALASWFNPCAFVANGPGTYGNAGRNSLRAPFDRRWDMSVKKVFYPHGERYRIELRADINNILNHTVFDAPGNSLASTKSFGVISSTVVSGRVIRLGLHLAF